MPVVTAFEADRQRRGRVLIMTDAGPLASVQRRALKLLGLREGEDIDRAAILGRLTEAEREAAHAVALDLLARQAYSVAEMKRRLAARGFTLEAAEAEAARLASAGLLDDGRLARDYVDARLNTRPAGRRLLRVELARRGVDRKAVESALVDAPSSGSADELELARRAAAERLRRRSPTTEPAILKREHRLMVDFLLRRGFGYETAERVALESLRPRGFDPDEGEGGSS